MPPLIEVFVETLTPVVELVVEVVSLDKLIVPLAMALANVKPVADEVVLVAV